MKKNLLFTLSFFLILFSLQAQSDTLNVPVYENQTLSWYEGYNTKAEFPEEGQEFRRINMHFTLGCPNSGCSDWDYTVLIKAFRLTGELDSTIAQIDTLSEDPLVLDTTWNVTEVKESFELGRMITPYAGYMARESNGFDNSWQHRYVYDVTDYASLLRDSVEFQIFYQGWSSGFSADLSFEMIEGTPPRNVVAIENLYTPGGYNYIEADTFEARHMPPKDITVPDGTEGTVLHFLPTGHGFVNSLNCAEFCTRFYFVRSMGITIDEQPMWRDDCGYNPIFPQGGTWLYNRANWCPGLEAIRYEHDLSDAIIDDVIQELDVDIDPYEYTVPSGETPANYNISAVLIHHSGYNFETDAELVDILQPSNHEAHSRYNPSCGTARVKLENRGGDPITSATIEYGIEEMSTFEWTGYLDPMKSTVIEMPYTESRAWSGDEATEVFSAEIVSVNGGPDDYADNNSLSSEFTTVPVIDQAIELEIRTNLRPQENRWTLKDIDGQILEEADDLQANRRQNWIWELSSGCHYFELHDSGEDGLSFFANNAGTGSARLRTADTPFPITIQNFPSDFGTKIDFYFNYAGVTSAPEAERQEISIYPNPASEFVIVNWPKDSAGDRDLRVVSSAGAEQALRIEKSGHRWRIATESWAAGMYFLHMTEQGEENIQKVVIQH